MIVDLKLRREREARCLGMRLVSRLDAEETIAAYTMLADAARTEEARTVFLAIVDDFKLAIHIMDVRELDVIDLFEALAGVYREEDE